MDNDNATPKEIILEEMYEQLNDGNAFITTERLRMELKRYINGQNRYFVMKPQLFADKNYIYYEHYGGSAVSNTYKNFKWIIETIFESDDVAEDFRATTLQDLLDVMNEGHGSWEFRGETDKAIIGREI